MRRTLYVGGQNGTDSEGRVTGDTAAQAARALRNVLGVILALGIGFLGYAGVSLGRVRVQEAAADSDPVVAHSTL